MKTFNFKPLVNVRTQKDEFSENAVATSVVGAFRFPPKVAAKLNIADYDALSIFSDEDEETGEVSVYFAKGHNGTIARDEDGNILTGGRNTTLFTEEDPMDGAIIRPTTEGSKILSVTSAATWKMLGGSKDKEIILSVESIGVMDYPLPSGTFVNGEVFEVKVVGERAVNTRAKSVKGEKGASSESVEDADIQEELDNTDYEEEEA